MNGILQEKTIIPSEYLIKLFEQCKEHQINKAVFQTRAKEDVELVRALKELKSDGREPQYCEITKVQEDEYVLKIYFI